MIVKCNCLPQHWVFMQLIWNTAVQGALIGITADTDRACWLLMLSLLNWTQTHFLGSHYGTKVFFFVFIYLHSWYPLLLNLLLMDFEVSFSSNTAVVDVKSHGVCVSFMRFTAHPSLLSNILVFLKLKSADIFRFECSATNGKSLSKNCFNITA